ncbi:conserved exported protein of unknown function [Candidatus Nitrospira inopinata]|jgi:hypothetical protein|uniref:Uncharacterized protein n=1 Tax=Candidatus Nitrospira inopinata TaxID=1715989 RepID=A0A0S4KTB5_9BACT|nr:conserved exported protein of unknown function [Candidatus Nitrospira inopinata]
MDQCSRKRSRLLVTLSGLCYTIAVTGSSIFLLQGDGMARGREKDRKTRKKHRKNVKRLKALAKTRRAAAKRGKKG